LRFSEIGKFRGILKLPHPNPLLLGEGIIRKKIKMKKPGFTIMELAIVILVLSMILLFLVFPLKKNLDLSRNSVRKSNISLMASLIKLDQLPREKKYNISKQEVLKIFRENLKTLPVIEADNHYFYGHSTKKEDFFVVVCSESRENFFVEGTQQAKQDLSVIYPAKACKNGEIPVGERFFPVRNNSQHPLDSYIIYKII